MTPPSNEKSDVSINSATPTNAELTEQAWRKILALNPKVAQMNLLMVLNDGETYSSLNGCTIVGVLGDIKTIEDTENFDLDLEVSKAVKNGWFSKYVKVLSQFNLE